MTDRDGEMSFNEVPVNHHDITDIATYCRAFLGQRRGMTDLSCAMKVECHGGGLKMGWSKPLRGGPMGVEPGPEGQEKAKS